MEELVDDIKDIILDFLHVPSLLHLGATSKYLHAYIHEQTRERRNQFIDNSAAEKNETQMPSTNLGIYDSKYCCRLPVTSAVDRLFSRLGVRVFDQDQYFDWDQEKGTPLDPMSEGIEEISELSCEEVGGGGIIAPFFHFHKLAAEGDLSPSSTHQEEFHQMNILLNTWLFLYGSLHPSEYPTYVSAFLKWILKKRLCTGTWDLARCAGKFVSLNNPSLNCEYPVLFKTPPAEIQEPECEQAENENENEGAAQLIEERDASEKEGRNAKRKAKNAEKKLQGGKPMELLHIDEAVDFCFNILFEKRGKEKEHPFWKVFNKSKVFGLGTYDRNCKEFPWNQQGFDAAAVKFLYLRDSPALSEEKRGWYLVEVGMN